MQCRYTHFTNKNKYIWKLELLQNVFNILCDRKFNVAYKCVRLLILCILDQKHIIGLNVGVSSHLYLYSAFNNTNCNKALHIIKMGQIVSIM